MWLNLVRYFQFGPNSKENSLSLNFSTFERFKFAAFGLALTKLKLMKRNFWGAQDTGLKSLIVSWNRKEV